MVLKASRDRVRASRTLSGCVRDLLKLWTDRDRHSADVKSVALAHVIELEKRAAELNSMIKTLRNLARACEGDERPECPIIDELEAGKPTGALRNGKAKKERRRPVARSPVR